MTGADDFLRLSVALKNAGRKDLRRQLNKNLRAAGKPLAQEAKQSAASRLPQSGGLAALVARRGARVKVSTSRSNPGISIVFNKTDPRFDAGRIAHPVFGRRPMVQQSIAPGFFTEPLERSAPQVLPHLERAITDMIDRVARLDGGG